MKNEPVVTYNHMEEDESSRVSPGMNPSGDRGYHPISLYMIFIVDIILIAGVVYMAMKAIF